MKNWFGVLAAGAALSGMFVTATPVTAAPDPQSGPTGRREPPSPCSSGLKLLQRASDEFDKALKNKWTVYDWGVNGQRSGELVYLPEMTRVEDGKLLLVIEDEPKDVDGDGSLEYPAGGVESTFDVPGATPRSASCVEVRTKGFAQTVASPRDQNVFSAVWLQTRPLASERNPNPEIDIQEFFETDKMHMALHTWESPPPPAPPTPPVHVAVDNCRTGREDATVDPPNTIDECRTEPLTAGDLTAEMHTYAVRREIVTLGARTAGLLTLFFDGRPVWTKELPADSPLVTSDRHLILSTQGNAAGGPGLAFPKVAEHDWVRTYG